LLSWVVVSLRCCISSHSPSARLLSLVGCVKNFASSGLENRYVMIANLSSVLISTQQHAERAICYRPSVRPSVSVCPSVTRVDQSKMVKLRLMQFSPYSSPIPLHFAICFIQKFQWDPLSGGVKQWWVAALRETSYFRSSNAIARWLPKLDILSQLLQTYSPGGSTVAR